MSFNFKAKSRIKINTDKYNSVVFALYGLENVNSYLAYELSQIASLSRKRTDIIFIDSNSVIDSDLVTGKFLKEDLSVNRAKVTASRCSASFNIDIEIKNDNVEVGDTILNIFKGRMGYLPVIICNKRDNKTLNIVKKTMMGLSDAMIILVDQCGDKGKLEICYKENGTYITDDYLTNTNVEEHKHINKTTSIELAKNIFLYLDDILCDRAITTDKVLIDMVSKTTSSKYIGEKEIHFDENINLKSKRFEINEKIVCVIIGLGGTGGSLAYEVSQLASVSDKDIKLVFIDGDIVENKNLNRQRFITPDLNQYKAEVTSKRCREAYGVDIRDINKYIENEEELANIINEYTGYTPIILGCSDSLKLRFLVCNTIKALSNIKENVVYIDGGNGEDYGQVNFTYIKNGEYVTPDYFQTSPESLEDVKTAKLVTEMSCGELMQSAPQTKGANLSSATIMYSYFESVVSGNNISTYMSYFNNNNRRVESKTI